MLTMRLVRLPDGAASAAVSRPVDPSGSSIGRSPECDLVLDDPLRLVSRRHAWIVPSGPDRAMLHCISTSASLMVNGEIVPPGGECPVAKGDRVCIGAFEFVLDAQQPAEAALIELSRHVAAAAPVPAEPVPPPIVATPRPAAPAPPAFRSSRLDRWFELDTVADPLGPKSPLAALAALDERVMTPAPPRPAAAAAGGAAAAPALFRPVVPAPTPARAEPPRAPSVPAAALAPAPAPAPDLPLRSAFLRGAGLSDDPSLGTDAAWAEHVGALLRSLTESTFELLRSRAVTKQNMRAERTQIVARENNPLKFAPDATECLRLLLQERAHPGFLPPLDALADAHRDLQMHQLAMLAGMRAAVAEMVLRLDPAAIEAAAGAPRGWSRFVPWRREAELWQRQREHHAQVLANLDDAFDAAFGREFLLAYEEQSRHSAPRR
jgi:type VI secretion system FHA domain protein